MSFLKLDNYHVFVTGAAGGIGQAIVNEFLAQGCKVTAHDRRPSPLPSHPNLHALQGDITSEDSVASSISEALAHFGPIHVLCANAGITDEGNAYPIWDLPAELFDKIHAVNVRGTFFTIKHFLRAAEKIQSEQGAELDNLAIVVTGSECGKFGQEGHSEYASGKAGLQYGLVRGVKNEIVRLNGKARINAVAPGWVDTPLIGDRLDDPTEMWKEAQATVALKKIAKPTDVARTVAFLASHAAAGHISGQCISVDGGMEGRLLWTEDDTRGTKQDVKTNVAVQPQSTSSVPTSLSTKKPTIKIALSVDFDAVSGWLGTGGHPDNNMADYSSGFFSARVGVPRLLRMFKRYGIADKVTWFIPGHSIESFPEQTKAIVATDCEIGLHGYCHEALKQLSDSQEREVLEKCIELTTALTGKKPRGFRAPLYTLREQSLRLLEEHEFLYDSSMSHHDCTPYLFPKMQSLKPIDYQATASAKDWMHPLPTQTSSSVVEIPCNWYMEDMTPMQFWPHTENSQGYVDARVIERMWMDRFNFLRKELVDQEALTEMQDMAVFPLVLHPDTSGMAHVLPMIERVVSWLKSFGDEVEFLTYTEIATRWRSAQEI